MENEDAEGSADDASYDATEMLQSMAKGIAAPEAKAVFEEAAERIEYASPAPGPIQSNLSDMPETEKHFTLRIAIDSEVSIMATVWHVATFTDEGEAIFARLSTYRRPEPISGGADVAIREGEDRIFVPPEVKAWAADGTVHVREHRCFDPFGNAIYENILCDAEGTPILFCPWTPQQEKETPQPLRRS